MEIKPEKAQSEIKPDNYYTPNDPEMRIIGAVQTLARWRCEGKDLAYIKSGSRVLYRGSDVLDFLNRNRVQPKSA